jgi:primase-polymerase (primpol)-like protein
MSAAPPKPTLARPYEFSNLPSQMKKLTQFVMWRWEWKDGRWTKAPFQINGKRASSTNPDTWCSFQQALAAYERERFRFCANATRR